MLQNYAPPSHCLFEKLTAKM